MALTKPVLGQKYSLSNAEPLGEGFGSIDTGTTVTVDALPENPEAGIAGDVVISWVTHQVEVGEEKVDITRRVSFSLSDFGRLFTSAGAKK